MEKPELLISAGSLADAKLYIAAGADAVAVGEQAYGLRLPGDVSAAEIKQLSAWAHDLERKAKVYAVVNKIFTNEELPGLEGYLAQLADAGVDAIVFGDPAVLMTARLKAPHLKLHWNAEMTSTNYVTANYWGTKGASRVVLARELNMDQVIEFKRHAELDVQVQVHGITNIYHSKRELVTNYMQHQGKLTTYEDLSMQRGLYVIEQERLNERYPVYEDINGTHIMSSDDFCMLENLQEFMDGGIDSLKIEGLMKTAAYNVTVIRSYRTAIDNYASDPQNYRFDSELLEAIQKIQDPERELTYGFFYKEQVY
jgi:U32 family peptidase